MSEQNKAIVRRFYEAAVNKGDLAVVDQVMAADARDHNSPPGRPPGAQGMKQVITMFRAGFPDIHITLEDMIAEGDKVVSRITARGTNQGEFMGRAPTGNQISVIEIHIVRIANGKIVEQWGAVDRLGLLTQLGFVSPPGQGA